MSGSTATRPGRSARAVRLTLDAWPLTPIHIGDGSRLTPESYIIREGQLCRFEMARVVHTMTAAERRNYLGALDRGDLAAAQGLLRRAVRDEAIVERVTMSEASARELRDAIADPLKRSGEVRPFMRTGGRPFIPGSSIKGALRTALASHWLPTDVSPAGLIHERAMQVALGLAAPQDTDSDPLRFVSVGDVELPDGTTLIDQTHMAKPGRDGKLVPASMQMHYERSRCYVEPEFRPKLQFSITLRPERGAMDRRIDRMTLLTAVHKFHWDVWNRERQRFFAAAPETVRAMDALLGRIKVSTQAGETTLAHASPEKSWTYMLLRIGRFGHFESKSLARVRQGEVPQARAGERIRPPDAFGSSRTLVRMPERDRQGRQIDGQSYFLPMGWMLTRVAETKETDL